MYEFWNDLGSAYTNALSGGQDHRRLDMDETAIDLLLTGLEDVEWVAKEGRCHLC